MKKTLFPTMLALSLLTTVLFVSCAKDEPKKAPTKTELLCSSPWIMTSLTVDPAVDLGNGIVITDYFTQVPACVKDNLNKYNSDGKGIYDEGASKCDPKDPQTTGFTWLFSADETKLIENETEEYSVVSLNETELILNQYIEGDEIGGNPFLTYKFTGKFKH